MNASVGPRLNASGGARPFFAERDVDPERPRLLLLSYHFPPGEATGALRWQKMAHFAAERGWAIDAVTVDPATLVVDDLFRLEGDSDPDEEVLVYALSQGPCGRMGTYTIQFGPTITPDDEAVAAILRKQPHTNHPT